MAPTTEQIQAGQQVVIAVAETIRESGQAPSGMVYAALMGRVTFEGYQKILAILTRAGLIRVDNSHMIHWIAGVK